MCAPQGVKPEPLASALNAGGTPLCTDPGGEQVPWSRSAPKAAVPSACSNHSLSVGAAQQLPASVSGDILRNAFFSLFFFFFEEFHDLNNNVCPSLSEALNSLHVEVLYSHLSDTSYPFRTPSIFPLSTQGKCVFMFAPRVLS